MLSTFNYLYLQIYHIAFLFRFQIYKKTFVFNTIYIPMCVSFIVISIKITYNRPNNDYVYLIVIVMRKFNSRTFLVLCRTWVIREAIASWKKIFGENICIVPPQYLGYVNTILRWCTRLYLHSPPKSFSMGDLPLVWSRLKFQRTHSR